MRKVEDMNITKDTSLSDLVKEFDKSGGVSSKKIADGISILEDIMKCEIRFLSFPAAIISTGTRGIVKELVKKKMFNVLITTCGMLDHDIARSFQDYFHGSFEADDAELRKKGINRLGN